MKQPWVAAALHQGTAVSHVASHAVSNCSARASHASQSQTDPVLRKP